MIKKINKKLAKRVTRTLEEFSVGKNPADNRKNTMVEVVDGYRLLGASIGSEEYAEAFLLKNAKATREDANAGKTVPRQANKTSHFKTVHNPAAFPPAGT